MPDTSSQMSANLDLVRSIYADWEVGDFSTAEWADPDIEYVSVEGPDPGKWSGVADLAGINREFLSAWTDWRVQAERYRELDEERVLVLTRRGGRGRRSGLQVWEPAANLIHLREGKITRLVFYWHRERALADLGLEEEQVAGARGASQGPGRDQAR
jgi:ketosteroid isomerase-like protein